MRLIFNWLVYTIAIIIAAYILPGVTVDSFVTALIVAVVLGVINAFLRPILLILTLPITIVTLGIFALVVNAFLVLLAASLVPGFIVAGFWSAFFFAIILTLISWFLHSME